MTAWRPLRVLRGCYIFLTFQLLCGVSLSDFPFFYLSFTGMLYNKTEYIWISSVKGAFP